MAPGRHLDRPDGTPEWLVMHFHDAVDVLLDGTVRRVPAQSLVIWPPGTRHWFGCETRWTHSWMFCAGARVDASIRASGLATMRPHAQASAATAGRYLAQIHAEITRPLGADPLVVEGLLALWLREAFRDATAAAAPSVIPARMLTARHLIDADPTQPFTLKRLAQAAGLSRSQFSAEFRRSFGTTPIRYLLDLRMRRARILLTDRSLTIGDIARRSGFSDPHYFARQFRAHFAMSPRQSRDG
ncbi:MAG: helix-turn-helix domain-containing protein [Planctomycetes bacterium]|nr:helix-turn-helix domain-containing protein [Planctomycetota bacterium]